MAVTTYAPVSWTRMSNAVEKVRARVALEDAGFVFRHAAGMDLFLDGPHAKTRDAVHIVFAGEKVRRHDAASHRRTSVGAAASGCPPGDSITRPTRRRQTPAVPRATS
jgi:hypothetical protein